MRYLIWTVLNSIFCMPTGADFGKLWPVGQIQAGELSILAH